MKLAKILAPVTLALALLIAGAPAAEAKVKPTARSASVKSSAKYEWARWAAGLRWAKAKQLRAGERGPFEIEFWGTVDGHRQCYALLGETSYVWCRDGYRTSS